MSITSKCIACNDKAAVTVRMQYLALLSLLFLKLSCYSESVRYRAYECTYKSTNVRF